MKTTKILSLLAVMLFSSTLIAQTPVISNKYSNAEIATLIENYRTSRQRDVLVDVALAQKFQQDFPKAYDVEWETNGEVYSVEFDVKFRDFEAYYDKDGNLLMYNQEIRDRELPAVVKTAAEAKYPKYKFEDEVKIVKGTETFYKIDMELRDTEISILVTNEGKIISEKVDY